MSEDKVALKCLDCGKEFIGCSKAHYCRACVREHLSNAAKARNLNKIGNDAYSAQQKRRRAEDGK